MSAGSEDAVPSGGAKGLARVHYWSRPIASPCCSPATTVVPRPIDAPARGAVCATASMHRSSPAGVLRLAAPLASRPWRAVSATRRHRNTGAPLHGHPSGRWRRRRSTRPRLSRSEGPQLDRRDKRKMSGWLERSGWDACGDVPLGTQSNGAGFRCRCVWLTCASCAASPASTSSSWPVGRCPDLTGIPAVGQRDPCQRDAAICGNQPPTEQGEVNLRRTLDHSHRPRALRASGRAQQAGCGGRRLRQS